MYKIYIPKKTIKKINRFNRIKEKHGHTGKLIIWSINSKTGEKKLKAKFTNLIMDATFNYDMQYLKGYSAASAGQIKHLVIGDDNTAPVSTNTTLNNEVYRVPVLTQTETATGELTSEFYITSTEFTGTIEELGIMGGYTDSEDWDGGSGKDTGNLLAHVLYSDTKTSNEELLIQRVDTFS